MVGNNPKLDCPHLREELHDGQTSGAHMCPGGLNRHRIATAAPHPQGSNLKPKSRNPTPVPGILPTRKVQEGHVTSLEFGKN